MKKLMVYGLSVMFIAGSVASCKKGKVSNEWKISSWSEVTTSTNDDGDVDVYNTTSDGVTISQTSTSTPSGGTATTTTLNGTVQKLSWTIAKDGTFTRELNVTFVTTFTGGSATVVSTTKDSGTWSLVGKNKADEFKKNERVMFTTLKTEGSETQTVTIGGTAGTPDVSTSSDTYASGEQVEVYTIVTAKGKEMELKWDGNSTSSSTSNGTTSTYKDVVTRTIKLIQE
jgi:hypothetical protein